MGTEVEKPEFDALLISLVPEAVDSFLSTLSVSSGLIISDWLCLLSGSETKIHVNLQSIININIAGKHEMYL